MTSRYRKIDRGLKAQNRKLPMIAAVFLLLVSIALLVLPGKNFDVPDNLTCTDFGILLIVLFVLFCCQLLR